MMSACSIPLMEDMLALQRNAFGRDRWPSYEVRRERLDRLLAMTQRFADRMVAAAAADFGHRSAHVTRLADVMMVEAAVRHTRRHLRRWMRARRVPTTLALMPGTSRVVRQPLGVVGIVSPWNYPFQLALGPASAALAAGNRVMIKPSELTPRCAELLREAVAETFAPDEMFVATGGVETAQAFVSLRFDHLLFTGSTAVGRHVAMAAARNLTPVTLELGGKSPALLSAGCDMQAAARSLALGKGFNAGQTCIAPDYVAVPRAREAEFVAAMGRAAQALYPNLASNPDCTSIINEPQHMRLLALLDDAREKGATIYPLAVDAMPAMPRLMAPTLVLNATRDMAVMREEIFGPLLPVIAYDTIDEAIGTVNAGERPLALYWFGNDNSERDRILRETHAGGVTVNDCMWHFAQENLPFGGIGASGIGSYHGEAGFRTFSHDKPVFQQSRLSGVPLLHPPYGRVFEVMARLLRIIT